MKKIEKVIAGLGLIGALATVPNLPVMAMSQDETVYTKLQSNGEMEESSVIRHLVNDKKDYQLFDRTNLSNVENLNGFESFVVDNGKVVWNAEGKDIYYSGKTQEALPISVKVEYKLNGETKRREEMMGQAGKVEVIYKFANHAKVGEVYTPFVAALTTTFKEGTVENLEVENGKTTSNGRTLAVAGVAAPGLYESLGIEELKNIDEVKLRFDTQKFEMNDVYIAVTPKLLDSEDLKIFTQLDELSTQANKLAASSRQLVMGAGQLSAGVNELRTGVWQAKQNLQNYQIGIDAATINQIKSAAVLNAEQAVEMQRAEIAAGVDAQLASPQSETLRNALHLQAMALCSASIGGADCPAANVQAVEQQILMGVREQLTNNSIELAKQTAREVASATAEGVATQLANGMGEKIKPVMMSAMDTILNGTESLMNGANELNRGMTQFNDEGIMPLVNFVNGKVKVTSNRVEHLMQLANDYQSYAGIDEAATGTTKFILMIDGEKAK